MSQGSQSQSLDDVPIALSEKWIPPPLPTITEDMVERFFLPRLGPVYDYTLEHKVLDKISRYEDARREAVEVRDERIRLRREEKARRLEAEGTKLKEKLTQLSYPSPEELPSSASSDDEQTTTTTTTTDEEVQPQRRPVQFELLMPIIVGEKVTSIPTWNGNATTTLDMSDFEKASDPFDCVELKTIDDLDVLAQVLKSSQHIHSTNDDESPPKKSTEKSTKGRTVDAITPKQDQQEQQQQQQQHQQEPVHPTINGYPSYPTYYVTANYVTNCYAPYKPTIATTQPHENEIASRLKSKSVPDIVQELEAEVNDSQKRRFRNNSQCADVEKRNLERHPEISRDSMNKRNCDEVVTKLPKEVQQLVEMGFPVDRVYRVAEQFHGDDKKIIDHIIPLSELLDLGFEEKSISEALIKFDNNKEKALDFLIS